MVIDATGEVKLGLAGLPSVGQEWATHQIAHHKEAITFAADPGAVSANRDVGEIIVGGVGDEGSVFGVGAGEGDGGGGVFEDAVVGDVAGEEGRVVGDFDLLVQGVGDIAVDGGEAAGEGDGAVVGKACAAGAKGSEAGDLAGIVKREIV